MKPVAVPVIVSLTTQIKHRLTRQNALCRNGYGAGYSVLFKGIDLLQTTRVLVGALQWGLATHRHLSCRPKRKRLLGTERFGLTFRW